MNAAKVIQRIPRETRLRMLTEWIPNATASLSNEHFSLLWEAYFIYVDSDAVKKTNCPLCIDNVLQTWRYLGKKMAELEKEERVFEQL